MKRLLPILYTALLLVLAMNLSFAEAPEGYPAIRIDPATGSAYDFGGATITIYDFWSSVDSDSRVENPTPEQAALYAYRDWLMSTYNCHIVQKQGGNWGTQASEFNSFVENPDGSYRIYIVEPGSVGAIIESGNAASWQNEIVDLEGGNWNTAAVDKYTIGDGTYAVSTGKPEPRQLLYFNKRVLTEAGIDWDDIYDMQQDGTWTWDAFEQLLNRFPADRDGDGTVDTYGLVGSSTDFYRIAVFSNGAAFFSDVDGSLAPTASSPEALYALNWAKRVWNADVMPMPEDASWDWYKQAWNGGQVAFYMYQAYGGFNQSSEMADMADPWGAVAFPIGPSGEKYVTISSDNATLLPNVYDEATAAKLAMIYELWTLPTPGYDSEDTWYESMLGLTDDRAVLETYGMLRDSAVGDKAELLGSINDVEGGPVLWSIDWEDPEGLIEAAMPDWQSRCDDFNHAQTGTCGDNLTWALTENGVLRIQGTGAMAEDAALWQDKTIVTVTFGEGVTRISSGAFANQTSLRAVTLPSTLESIGEWAFSGCSSLTEITLPENLATIEDAAFLRSGLERVNLPEGAEAREWAFYAIDYTNYEEHAFAVALPASVTAVNSSAFANCALPDLVPDFIAPDSLQVIGKEAFVETGATYVYLPDGINAIESDAFAGCQNLRYIRVPASCQTIEEGAIPEGVTVFTEYGSTAATYAENHSCIPVLLFEGFNG